MKQIPSWIKAALLSVLFYIAIPSIDDAFSIPVIAYFLSLPLLLVTIIYYGTAWLLVFAIELFL